MISVSIIILAIALIFNINICYALYILTIEIRNQNSIIKDIIKPVAPGKENMGFKDLTGHGDNL